MGNEKIPNRDNWKFVFKGSGEGILYEKDRLIRSIIFKMLSKTQRIFEYKNLPEELPQREIELLTQTVGFTIWKKVNGKHYVFYGGLGGIPNEYYLPTEAIVVNPFLKYNARLEIDEDCVVMWNDSMHTPINDINERYASLIAETEISLRVATVWSRVPVILNTTTDTDKDSAQEYLKDIEAGKLASLMTEDFAVDLTKTFNVQDVTNKTTTHIKELMEEHQYLYAKWWNEFGVNANYNMKREAINESEASMNEDALLPYIDDMLQCRKEALEKINEMWGTNIEVDYASSWKKLREDIKTAQEVEESQVENNEDKPESESNPEDTQGEENA